MDNLEVASIDSFKFDRAITGEVLKVSVEDIACCFLTNSDKLVVCEYNTIIKTFLLEENIHKTVIQLKYLNIWQVIFIATKTSLLIYEPKKEELKVVQTFSRNITHTSWNPNETFLVVADENNQLFGFTFEVNSLLSEYHLTETYSARLDGAAPHSVYVGWGSHNTQFKGAKKKDDEKIEEVAQQYSPPVISWRGNGEQFVINFWKDHKRFLKVFDNYLRPLFQSEAYPNLLAPTSFKGQGNFIACGAQHNEKNKIVIFEKNCLMKSEFFVPENRGRIKYLQYHPDLHILAVCSEDFESDGHLNIYLYVNAKWYLKQQLYYPADKKLISFHWSTFPDKTMCTLNVITSEAVERYLFRIIISRFFEDSLIAVIDGLKVHFTKFSEEILPPPLSSFSLDFEKPVNKIFFNSYIYQFLSSDGITHSYTYEKGIFKRCFNPDLPPLTLDVTTNSSSIIYYIEKTLNNIQYEFLLDRQQDLLINGTIGCSSVLSMYVHQNYLLFTHASSKLYCIRIIPENISNITWSLNKFYFREIEQGAKIVCVTNNSDIVLQLPRGNLETVTCRVIAIDSIEELLAQNKWKDAMYRIRQQRLNWNILIDLNPERFSKHIKEFIEAAETVSVLSTAISEFFVEDCFQTVYENCLDDDRAFLEFDKTKVFQLILEKIMLINPVLNLLSIVTLQAKHFSLKSALNSVCIAFQMGELEICKKAVVQILLHRHVKDVINEAFTLYNINFMAFIYTCCSEDPKIFEPELAKLLTLDDVELRFQMNVLGKNYKAATKYLIRCSNFDERYISDFIVKHVTQSVAYESVCPKHPNFKLISQLFAQYLSMRARHNEAGFVLERTGLCKEALEEYKRGLNWHQVLSLLEELRVEDNSKKEVLMSLANDLINHKKIDEAVLIYEYNCAAHEKAIEVLIEQRMFQKALNLARKYNCISAIGHVIKPAIIKYRTDLYDRIIDLGNKFMKYTERLQTVRYQKLESMKCRLVDEGGDFENDVYSEYGSIVSSSGSTSSRSSRGSTMSSRNRRKQEKKKIDLREGGVYEDIALIRQLYLLAVDIFECGQEVQEISLTLTDDESFSFCTNLHEKLSSIQDSVRSNIPKIWSNTFLNAQESPDPKILAVVENRYELDAEFRIPPPSDRLMDNWKLFIFIKE